MQHCVPKSMKNKLFFENCLLYNYILKKRNHYSLEGNGWNSSIFILYIYHIFIFLFMKKRQRKISKIFLLQHQKTTSYSEPRKKNHDAILRAESLAATRVLWLSLKGTTGKGAHCARAWWACQKFGQCHQLRGGRNNIVWECKACYFTFRQRTYFFQKWNYFVLRTKISYFVPECLFWHFWLVINSGVTSWLCCSIFAGGSS